MSVLLETSLGDVTIDLLVDDAPRACENFLKLCKIKFYNFSPIYNVQPNFSFQSGDPIGPGSTDSDGGSSIWGILDPSTASKKTFAPEFHPKMKHTERGMISMACAPAANDPDTMLAGSQFIITLADNIEYLDGRAAIFGTVVEGFDTLEKINTAFIDETGRPLKDIRIRHTIILEDPFPDPPGLSEPPSSPLPSAAQLATVRIADDEEIDDNVDQETLEKLRREREARAQALTLEMVGDLPFAEVKPPENVLFVCKLNPVTEDDDLRLLFSRFGKILSCEVIRDKKTGDSLQYAFIEFENQKDCENAYFKMEGVLIDDHRIHVDFSQSVSRLSDVWRNATNDRRKRAHGGGFGGIANLEKKRQFREEETPRERGERDSRYGMVFDRRKKEHERRDASRSRSPPRRNHRERERSRDRYRERSKDRYHDDKRRDRDRSRDRYSRDDKRRNRSRERHRDDRHREGRDRRDRSRDRHRSDRDRDGRRRY